MESKKFVFFFRGSRVFFFFFALLMTSLDIRIFSRHMLRLYKCVERTIMLHETGALTYNTIGGGLKHLLWLYNIFQVG